MSLTKYAVALLLLVHVSGSIAAGDPASFESFYATDSSISWAWVAAGALVAGGVVLATGGTASPLVAGIGTWVGNMMGLSGIAATNGGLALLGGGSLAAGGLGMAGGAAAISFTMSLVGGAGLDMAVNRITEAQQQQMMADASARMTTLCPPVNGEGSDAYRAAFEIVNEFKICEESVDVDAEAFHSAVKEAIQVLKNRKTNEDIDESVKEDTLLGLLYFIDNDYLRAYTMATLAIDQARSQGQDMGLAEYILAVSSLYRRTPNYPEITRKYLKNALLEDPKNPLMIQLLSIYTERSLLAVAAGKVPLAETSALLDVLGDPHLKTWQARVALILLPYYVDTARDLRRRLGDLENTVNPVLKKAPQTLARIKELRGEYEEILLSGKTLIMALDAGLDRLIKENGFDKDQEKGIRSLMAEMSSMMSETANNTALSAWS